MTTIPDCYKGASRNTSNLRDNAATSPPYGGVGWWPISIPWETLVVCREGAAECHPGHCVPDHPDRAFKPHFDKVHLE